MDDEKTNKTPEATEFNAAQQRAIDIAKALPAAIYGADLKKYAPEEDAESIMIQTEFINKRDPYASSEDEVKKLFYGAKDGDVIVNHDFNLNNKEFFPPQLELDDIVRIIRDGDDKAMIMIEKGIDPNTVPQEKLIQYLYGDVENIEGEKELINSAIEKYNELWSKKGEEVADEIEKIKTATTAQIEQDENKISKVKEQIEDLPEDTPTPNSAEEVIEESKPKSEKKGFFKRLFGKK